MARGEMRSGDYLTLYELRVVDKTTKSYDPKRLYYAIRVTLTNGKVTKAQVQEIREQQYRAMVPEEKKQDPR